MVLAAILSVAAHGQADDPTTALVQKAAAYVKEYERRLSYEIAKKVEGIYAVVDLTSDPAAVQELDRQLNLNDEVLRTKVLRPELR